MALPNVNITLGNGGLGRVAASDDGVAGLILTGTEVEGKLEINKRYQLSSTRDLETLGVVTETNAFLEKEIKAFYSQAGEGAELHLMVVSHATTLTQMCDSAGESPLVKLIDGTAGRVKIVGVNKKTPADYEAVLDEGIDGDAITAAEKAQQTAENFAKQVRPFRLLVPALDFVADCDKLYQPRASSYNCVGFVLASDDKIGKTAAIGLVLGRAAKIEPQQSIGRVKDGAIATDLYLTNGKSYIETNGIASMLNDAGYVFPRSFPTKNGAYLNGDAMAAPVTDDYSKLSLGRIIDKARVICYATYISEILDNIAVDDKGQLPTGTCKSFEGTIENAIGIGMNGQISSFKAYIDPAQNILSSGTLEIKCSIVPLGLLTNININLSFTNPALNK